MKLGLSSAAAPDASAADLVAVCARRGLATLEVAVGGLQGMTTAGAPEPTGADERSSRPDGDHAAETTADLVAALADTPVSLAGIRCDPGADPVDAAALQTAHLAHALGTRLIVPLAAVPDEGGADTLESLLRIAPDIAVSVRGLPDELERLQGGGPLGTVGVAWDARPDRIAVDRTGEAVRQAVGSRLVLIRLFGGGPETGSHEGKGIGGLLSALALDRWQGDLILTPSSPRFRVAWSAWLGRRGGWGCGGAGRSDELVRIHTV